MCNPNPPEAKDPALDPVYEILGYTSLVGYRDLPDGHQIKYVLRLDPALYPKYSIMRYRDDEYQYHRDAYFHSLAEALDYFRRILASTRKE